MPQLAELQTEFGGDTFEVVAIATGRNPLPAIERFFEEIGVDNLPIHLDPRSALARDSGVFRASDYVPNSRRQRASKLRGCVGDAEWNGESAQGGHPCADPAGY